MKGNKAVLMKFLSTQAQKLAGEDNVFVDKSSIEGQGLFAGKGFKKGEVIGLAHQQEQPVGLTGNFHNHSPSPNAVSVKQGSSRFLVAAKNLPAGAEITSDYRMQPELEQPSANWMQRGGLTFQQYYTPAAESTGANYTPIMTVQAAEKLKAQRDAQELARRKQAIQASQAAASKPLRERLTPENLAQETGATGDKLRFFPNDPDSFIDDYLNPFKMVGDMASGLGRLPLNLKQGNYGQAAMSVATPLVVGATAGLGAKSAGQFVNNLANPLVGTGQFLTTKTPLKNAYKYNPWAFKPNSEAYYRVLGKEGLNDALESGVIRANPKNIHPFSGEPIYDRPYFSKGVPFDRDWKSPFKNKKGKQVVGSIYPDETMVEVLGHNKFHKTGDLVTSPIGVLNSFDKGINFYKRDWLRGYKEVPKPKQLPGSSNVNSVVNTAKNLEDLKAAQQFAQQYGYELPINIERIAQSNQLTDRTIRGMMDRHNTFVRGVSTNWDELGKRNPEILRHLEGKGFDLSTKEGTQAAAEYMATHIPINTGYGRASLNNEVFDRGMDGLYTSNSIPTAEGYTYGQGFITKAKRPTNYSSSNRQDWISQNNPYYRDEDKFRELMYPLSDEAKYAIYSSKQKSWTPKSFDEKSLKNATPKQKAIKEVEYRIEQLKKDISEIEPNKDKFVDAPEVIYSKKETIKQLENDIKYLNQHGDELLQAPGEFKILRTERSDLPTDPFNFLIQKEGNAKKMTEWLKTQPYQQKMREMNDLGESLTKYTWEQQKPIRDKIDILKKEANEMYNQSVQDYMKVNHPDYDPVNKYAHYIHLGTPGEKVLQPIKSWEITPEIWKNKSRSHTNKYSKKFSAMSIGGMIAPPPAAIGAGTYGVNQKQDGGQHGGLDRWFAEKWVDIKTGKECGRQEGEKRAGYPACRPSKRISEDTPKTASELSSSEKEKFKRSKTSSERISYQHKRKQDGGEWLDKYENTKENRQKVDQLFGLPAAGNVNYVPVVESLVGGFSAGLAKNALVPVVKSSLRSLQKYMEMQENPFVKIDLPVFNEAKNWLNNYTD